MRCMTYAMQRPLGALFLSCACLGAWADEAPSGPGLLTRTWTRATDVDAWQGPGTWRFNLSPFSRHFRYSDEHRYVWAIGAEKETADNWLAGASYFSNSFGQPSAYVYMGRRFPALFGQPALFAQVSVGVLYGYVGKYQHKVPLNYGGFSPGALVSLGWQFNSAASATVHMLGDAGFMVQLSYDFR